MSKVEQIATIIREHHRTHTRMSGPVDVVTDHVGDNDAAKAIIASLARPQGGGESYAAWQQKRGLLADTIDWAINEYDQFMLDDAYDAQAVLDRIVTKLRDRREALRASPADEADKEHAPLSIPVKIGDPYPRASSRQPLAAPADDRGDALRDARTPPDLLSRAEEADLLADAEVLWRNLQANTLGGFSGRNRPFYILAVFKHVIEKYGHRDVGLTWSTDAARAALATREGE